MNTHLAPTVEEWAERQRQVREARRLPDPVAVDFMADGQLIARKVFNVWDPLTCPLEWLRPAPFDTPDYWALLGPKWFARRGHSEPVMLIHHEPD